MVKSRDLTTWAEFSPQFRILEFRKAQLTAAKVVAAVLQISEEDVGISEPDGFDF